MAVFSVLKRVANGGRKFGQDALRVSDSVH